VKRSSKAVSKHAQEKTTPPAPPAPASGVGDGSENRLGALLLDVRKPAEVRARLLLDILHTNANPNVQQLVLCDLLHQIDGREADAQTLALMEQYERAIGELQQGAVRPATFLAEAADAPPGPAPRAHVVTPDGQERYPVVHDRVSLNELRPGMTVYLDPKGAVVLGATRTVPRVGQEGNFLRAVEGTTLVEAALREERLLLHAAAPVLDALAAGQLRHGDRLLVCPRRQVAFAVVPPEKDYRHRFVERERLPEVVAERDIGNPHPVLGLLRRRLRLLLSRPDLLERFGLPPRFAALLTGPSGCGKSLTIRAFLTDFDRLLAERTGRRDLGSRVIRVKVADLLSEWLGRSDKNVEELFNDIQAVAAAEVETARGERLRLPVVVILEEVEGIARRRGGADAAVYDRVLTTLLQRLDGPTDDLARLPLFVLSTSNRPDLIDAAMRRRLGAQARFTRLDREGLAAVLDKKLRPELPYAAAAGGPAERGQVLEAVVGWLFGAGEGAHGLTEITLHDGVKMVRRRRDFLTGGLVEQAVAAAIERTVAAALDEGAGAPGLTAAAVIEALREQTDALADSLTVHNVADHLDLPENARVESVRRLRGPAGPLPYDFTDLLN
jgi:ATP-dependent 26S proteasome regulatory subunit